ncbi:MAG: hypothetical protein AABZ20_01030 [candidate division NC10 bacterium]
MLTPRSFPGIFRVIGDGFAEKLRERIDQHATHSDNKCVRGKVNQFSCYVAWAAVAGEEDRDGAERALYFRFKPECNDRNGVPDGPDLDVNTDMA